MFSSGDQCLSKRPHLASIANKEEETFLINSILGGASNVWVGARTLSDGSWIWLDGTEFSYTNWKANEPSNDFGKEDSIVINWDGNGKWNDITSSHPKPMHHVNGCICQYMAFW